METCKVCKGGKRLEDGGFSWESHGSQVWILRNTSILAEGIRDWKRIDSEKMVFWMGKGSSFYQEIKRLDKNNERKGSIENT